MKESGKNQEFDKLIEEEMRTAFGYGKDSLIAEFDQAAGELDESARIPPDGEFQKIAAKVHEFEKEKKKSSKRVVRLKRVGKVGLLVAILGCVLMGTGIGASGKRAYEYSLRVTNQGKTKAWNNTNYLIPDDDIEDAYNRIREEQGIRVLRLFYIPKEMNLTTLLIDDGYSRMEFTKDDIYFYYIQSQYPIENSGNSISDREDVKSVFNKALDKELNIYENLLPNKKVELSTEFVIDKTYYYLDGIISEKEFEQMLENINY